MLDPEKKQVVRFAPTDPPPAPVQTPPAADPPPLAPGPISAGRHASRPGADPPYALVFPTAGWTDVGFGASVDLGARVLRPVDRRGEWVGDFSVMVLSQLIDEDGGAADVANGRDLVRRMRRNRALAVSEVAETTLGGRPALHARLRALKPRVPDDYCGVPCVPLFPIPFGIWILGPGQGSEIVVTIDPPLVAAVTTEPEDLARRKAFRPEVDQIVSSVVFTGG